MHDIEPQAQPLAALALRVADLIELPEYGLLMLLCNPDSGVPDLNPGEAVLAFAAACQQHRAGMGIAQRVAQQVQQDAMYLDRVTQDPDLAGSHAQT